MGPIKSLLYPPGSSLGFLLHLFGWWWSNTNPSPLPLWSCSKSQHFAHRENVGWVLIQVNGMIYPHSFSRTFVLIFVWVSVFQLYKLADSSNRFEWKRREVGLQWIRQDICSYFKGLVILVAWQPSGLQDISKRMNSGWRPSQTQTFLQGKMLVHFFHTPPNLNLQSQPDLIWTLLFVPAIYSYCPPPQGPFLRHTLEGSHIIYWHNIPFSREVFHFNKKVYHHI